jgi:hypothetical protein
VGRRGEIGIWRLSIDGEDKTEKKKVPNRKEAAGLVDCCLTVRWRLFGLGPTCLYLYYALSDVSRDAEMG